MDAAASPEWASATVVENSEPFVYTADLQLGDGITDPATREKFQRCSATVAIENWRFRDVSLVPAVAMVFKQGMAVTRTRYCVYGDEESRAAELLSRPHRQLSGQPCFLGFNRVSSNYFHQLTQIVPAIAGYQAEPGFPEGVLLLRAAGCAPVVSRALALAGVAMPETVGLDAGTPLAAEDLTVSSLLTGCNGPSLFRRAVFDRMMRAVPRPDAAAGPSMIYVWRLDSAARPMRNEDALVAMLACNGVVPVVLSELSLDQQIALFRDARLVIGGHGAGLANVVFCDPGAVLYELFPNHYVNPCVQLLAQMRGLHYACDIHPADPAPGQWRHEVAWSVDVDAVERRLQQILSAYDKAALPAPACIE
jgi:hypothetical protein